MLGPLSLQIILSKPPRQWPLPSLLLGQAQPRLPLSTPPLQAPSASKMHPDFSLALRTCEPQCGTSVFTLCPGSSRVPTAPQIVGTHADQQACAPAAPHPDALSATHPGPLLCPSQLQGYLIQAALDQVRSCAGLMIEASTVRAPPKHPKSAGMEWTSLQPEQHAALESLFHSSRCPPLCWKFLRQHSGSWSPNGLPWYTGVFRFVE